MMLGEIEYEDLYYPDNLKLNLTLLSRTQGTGEIEEEIESQSFKGSAQFMVILFVILASMIIMNLLIGLAVSNIQVFYKNRKIILKMTFLVTTLLILLGN